MNLFVSNCNPENISGNHMKYVFERKVIIAKCLYTVRKCYNIPKMKNAKAQFEIRKYSASHPNHFYQYTRLTVPKMRYKMC